jgi:hypothetical protein
VLGRTTAAGQEWPADRVWHSPIVTSTGARKAPVRGLTGANGSNSIMRVTSTVSGVNVVRYLE